MALVFQDVAKRRLAEKKWLPATCEDAVRLLRNIHPNQNRRITREQVDALHAEETDREEWDVSRDSPSDNEAAAEALSDNDAVASDADLDTPVKISSAPDGISDLGDNGPEREATPDADIVMIDEPGLLSVPARLTTSPQALTAVHDVDLAALSLSDHGASSSKEQIAHSTAYIVVDGPLESAFVDQPVTLSMVPEFDPLATSDSNRGQLPSAIPSTPAAPEMFQDGALSADSADAVKLGSDPAQVGDSAPVAPQNGEDAQPSYVDIRSGRQRSSRNPATLGADSVEPESPPEFVHGAGRLSPRPQNLVLGMWFSKLVWCSFPSSDLTSIHIRGFDGSSRKKY